MIELGSRRELFVDHFLIEKLTGGASLQLHNPRDEGMVIPFDQPWEGAFCAYVTIIKDGSKYMAFYRGIPTAGQDGRADEVTCYAESKDGIRWTKPALGLFEYDGSKANNIILAHAAPVTHNFSPFRDTRPGVEPDKRFKALGGTQSSGLIAYTSPDGIHWKKWQEQPVFSDGAFDSQNVSFWSAAEQCYVLYFRTWRKQGEQKFRTVSRTTSTDFLHWSAPQQMQFGDAPLEHLYTNQTHPYFRAPHIYVAIAARFMPKRQILTEAQAREFNVIADYFKDCSDAMFMTSRGGADYDRTFMEAFIRPGIGLNNWVSRTNYPALNVVQTGENEMSVYVNQDYAQPGAHLHRYSLRLDGFASLHAPYRGGEMITRPFKFEGTALHLNFATSAAGGIRIEILDEAGNPIPGFEQEKAQEIIGNEIERRVFWKEGSDLSALAGKPIRLRFSLKDADVYGMWFR
ncbi:MAG: hypothetical protein H6696_16070 [Deferribacteres bacterium]|nr:hypothetical protein [candidate division KSB1 bacterium]MCB9503448.1 hypothetical protein [Deferribacteres bacterium]